MAQPLLPTRFLPAERTTAEEVRRQHNAITASPLVRGLLDAMPTMVLLLNEQQQIFYANKAAVDALGGGLEALLGKRPGEAVGCVHAREESGCGTTEFCTTCGVCRAMAAALGGKPDTQECRIQVESPKSDLDLEVWATPFHYQDFSFTVFAAVDISHKKRRRILERIFFHDVLNTAGGIKGLTELMSDSVPPELLELAEDLKPCSERLVEEILSLRDLTAIESGAYRPNPTDCPLKSLLEAAAGMCADHETARGLTVVVDPGVPADAIVTDRALLMRVVGNMLENAVEAESVGAVITVGAEKVEGGSYAIWVRNPTVIPRQVQLQIFQRSFSTKGAGRGLGTYSVKLLTERLLKGKASFTSTAGAGTEFRITIPASI